MRLHWMTVRRIRPASTIATVAVAVLALTAVAGGAEAAPAATPAGLFSKDIHLCVVNQRATSISMGIDDGLTVATRMVAPGGQTCVNDAVPKIIVTYANGLKIAISAENPAVGSPYVNFLDGLVGTPISVFPDEGTGQQVTMYGRPFRVERKNDTDYKEFVVDVQGAGGAPSSATLCVASTVPEKGLLQWERPVSKEIALEASKSTYHCVTGPRDAQAADVAGRVSFPAPGRGQVWQVSMDADTAAAFRVGVSAGSACQSQLELGFDEVEAVTCGDTRVIVARGLGADQRPRVKLTFEDAAQAGTRARVWAAPSGRRPSTTARASVPQGSATLLPFTLPAKGECGEAPVVFDIKGKDRMLVEASIKTVDDEWVSDVVLGRADAQRFPRQVMEFCRRAGDDESLPTVAIRPGTDYVFSLEIQVGGRKGPTYTDTDFFTTGR